MKDQLPRKIEEARDILCLDKDDDIITILRSFNWNNRKMEEQWFEEGDEREFRVGLKFDPRLIK